jgi:hypothetical protein
MLLVYIGKANLENKNRRTVLVCHGNLIPNGSPGEWEGKSLINNVLAIHQPIAFIQGE